MSEELDRRGVIDVDGAILRYACEGSGTPALVIGSSIYYPRTFSRRLRERMRLAFVDTRHFAEPTGSVAPGDVSLNTYLADIAQAQTQLGFDRVVLIGHSHHGNLALEYAKWHPERVSHVVLIGTPPVDADETVRAAKAYWKRNASEPRKRLLREQVAAFRAEQSVRLLPAQAYIAEYVAEGPKYWFNPHYDASPLWQGVPLDMGVMAVFRGFFAEGYELQWDPEQLTAPVFLAMGRHDYAVPPTLWDEDRLARNGLAFRLFERSGHTPQLEEPEEFDRMLLEWLELSAGSQPLS
ncbi:MULTISPECIES: alpha/beta fold hydrolase [unclassified Thioalkalivibrio]|uniref:alpha/beta fold hydrolase n=1 Tax=unclassified Thioalkalivibrio TaxID=2621013 RepID=UPI001E42906F|nr:MULTISPECIES: alpha/beta hydrolase [unclassified Thioalkalivibrio]